MGMIIKGKWRQEIDASIQQGAFVRTNSCFDNVLPTSVAEEIKNGTSRYILVASMSCPWSHRAMLVRAFKKAETHLPVHIAGGPRVQGYGLLADGPLTDNLGQNLRHVHKLYALTNPAYTGRSTVPLLWDTEQNKIISNDSANIMRCLDLIDGADGFTLVPDAHKSEIEKLNQLIHENLGNAVYKAGLAQKQQPYEEAVNSVFKTMEYLDNRLSKQRFLFGSFVSESDLRLFATLVRFDAVYNTHFRCTRFRLTDFEHLWGYSRDLYQWPNVQKTVDFGVILDGYYSNDGAQNPYKIIAERPSSEWNSAHKREKLGVGYLWPRKRELEITQ